MLYTGVVWRLSIPVVKADQQLGRKVLLIYYVVEHRDIQDRVVTAVVRTKYIITVSI